MYQTLQSEGVAVKPCKDIKSSCIPASLSLHQIIHCDLAARNILISKGHTLKIADFGMAKELGQKEYHRRSPKDWIPVKWTAPEALESWVYSHKSDV